MSNFRAGVLAIVVILALSFCVRALSPAPPPQLLVSSLGAIVVCVFFILFRQFLPSSKAALTAALALALLGTFVFSTGCTWKETLGFLLLGIVLSSHTRR